MGNWKRKSLTGWRAVGTVAVAGVKDWETNRVAARRMEKSDASELQSFVRAHVAKFAARYNIRDGDTIDMMRTIVRHAVGGRLHYRDFIAENGRLSGARPAP